MCHKWKCNIPRLQTRLADGHIGIQMYLGLLLEFPLLLQSHATGKYWHCVTEAMPDHILVSLKESEIEDRDIKACISLRLSQCRRATLQGIESLEWQGKEG